MLRESLGWVVLQNSRPEERQGAGENNGMEKAWKSQVKNRRSRAHWCGGDQEEAGR